jgi:hypothetical protein
MRASDREGRESAAKGAKEFNLQKVSFAFFA